MSEIEIRFQVLGNYLIFGKFLAIFYGEGMHDNRDLLEQADLLQKQRHWKPARMLGIYGLYPMGKGRQQPVLIAVDLCTG
jgi:hypothetical protein